MLGGLAAKYICNPGHRLQGSDFLLCQPDGKWPDAPTCIRDPTLGKEFKTLHITR